MSTSIMLHDFARIKARAVGTEGAPLVIELRDANDRWIADFSLFTENHALSQRIADAINDAVRQHEAETVEAA